MRPIRFVAVEAIIGASKGSYPGRPNLLMRLRLGARRLIAWCRARMAAAGSSVAAKDG